MLPKTVIVLLAYYAIEASGSDWSYHGANGPAHWKDHFPDCGLKGQSPINVEPTKTEYKEESLKLNYNRKETKGLTYTLANNGHSAQITLGGDFGNLKASVFGETFKPLQVHFHWGSKNSIGSEHTVNGKQFSAEMHFVHINTKYSSPAEAVKHQDGLLVLGTFIKVGGRNRHLARVFKKMDDIEKEGAQKVLRRLSLRKILPSNIQDFFHYDGSLTTPHCNQAVKWILFRNPITISSKQIEEIRNLEGGDGEHISDNFRPTQPLNGRPVYRTFN